MTLDEAVERLLALRSKLPDAVRAGVEPLLDRLERAGSAVEQRRLVDEVVTLGTAYDELRDHLAPIAEWLDGRRGVTRGGTTTRDAGELPPGNGGGTRTITPGGGLPADRTPATIARMPHLDTDAVEPVPVGARFTVSVCLDAEGLRDGEIGVPVVLPDLPLIDLDVVLVASDHFNVVGENTGTLTVRSDEERSSTATWEAECVTSAAGTPALTAMFTYNGRPAGFVWRSLTVADVSQPHEAPDMPAPAVQIDAEARQPDLVVRIARDPDAEEQHFVVTITTPWLDEYARGVTVPWRLPAKTKDFVQGFMDVFLTSDPGGRKFGLVGAGRRLFQATPQEFQDAVWGLIDGGEPLETILVVTAEPYIPWELMIPNRDGESRSAPLGVDYAVGRWVHPHSTSPQQLAPLQDSYVIAPKYRGTEALSFSAEEAQYVIEAFDGQPISPAYLTTIDATLKGRGTTLLHFICHGLDSPTGQVLKLDPDQQLNEVQLEGMDGVIQTLRSKQPFVFINACEVGRSNPALVGTGGFAAVFTRLGARCVIAPIWSVKDSVAGVVARQFYDDVQANPTKPFAEVLRDIRKLAYEGDNPEDSYAAYCFYGDPLAAREAA